MKSWTAFEEHVFDLVGVPFHDLRHAGIERCLFGIGSEGIPNFSPDGMDEGFGIGLRRQLLQPLQPLLVYLVLALHEELLDHSRETVERAERGCFSRACGLHRVGRKMPGERYTGTSRWKARGASCDARCSWDERACFDSFRFSGESKLRSGSQG